MSNNSYKGENNRIMMVVADTDGEIVATAGIADEHSLRTRSREDQLNTGLKPLPGQSIHILEMPDDFFRCDSAIERHKWLSRRQVVNNPEPIIMEKYSTLKSGAASKSS